jgi:hypothetical protein
MVGNFEGLVIWDHIEIKEVDDWAKTQCDHMRIVSIRDKLVDFRICGQFKFVLDTDGVTDPKDNRRVFVCCYYIVTVW